MLLPKLQFRSKHVSFMVSSFQMQEADSVWLRHTGYIAAISAAGPADQVVASTYEAASMHASVTSQVAVCRRSTGSESTRQSVFRIFSWVCWVFCCRNTSRGKRTNDIVQCVTPAAGQWRPLAGAYHHSISTDMRNAENQTQMKTDCNIFTLRTCSSSSPRLHEVLGNSA